jgi:phenylacetyl-CoA:acceptor oxidoreductase
MRSRPAAEIRTLPTTCYQCNAGPEMLNVRVEDGVATEVRPHFESAGVHPGGGKVCVKAYGLIQKVYHPHRVKTPMVRTNPKKGRHEDPGWRAISWDEALDLVAQKMSAAKANGVMDASGYPRVATTFGGGPTSIFYLGTMPAFFAAWGATDVSMGSGQGVKCAHSEHMYGEFWHRGFTVAPDTPLCNYLLSFGHNMDSSGGVCSVKRHADARIRGMIRVQVEPHLSVTGASSSEWVPIKPKTDPAFMFAMIHVLLHESSRDRLDLPFLKERTGSPYLVAPNGFYLRDPATDKPLVWDLARGAAVPHDTAGIDPALDGAFTLDGVELGADGQRWTHRGVVCRTAFQCLVDHVKSYTPEWASAICDVPGPSIRRIALEYLSHARIGETIEIDGKPLPFRPVAIFLGKTVNNGWGGYESCWGRTVLACLVGALEVPGGTLGTSVLINEHPKNRNLSVHPGPDGFMDYPLNPTDKENWISSPTKRDAARTLVPLAGNSPRFKASGPGHLSWMTLDQGDLPGFPAMTLPDVWFVYRANPAISFWQVGKVEEITARFPFTVCFAFTDDETNHMADLLLPECTDLESMQLLPIGGTKYIEAFWAHRGYALRRPVVEPASGVRDFTWIATELAKRTGVLKGYNAAINNGLTGIPLRTKDYNFALDESAEHSKEEIWDHVCRAASFEVTAGAASDGLDYYLEHGLRVSEYPRTNWYLYPTMVAKGLRFELPYQERLMRIGIELGNRLHEKGIAWWDKQLAEYSALPAWHDIPGIWEKAYESSFGIDITDFPFWLLTSRSMQYAWGANAGIQLIKEVADNVAGHGGVILNARTARQLGIADGDLIEVRSPIGATQGHAVVRQGIRPDTVLMIGQFGHWKTPIAKDFKAPSMNSLVPMLMETTDNSGSGADLVRVSVRRVGGAA